MSVSGKWLAVAIAASVCATGSQAAVLYSQTTANTGIAGLGAPVAVTDPTSAASTTAWLQKVAWDLAARSPCSHLP